MWVATAMVCPSSNQMFRFPLSLIREHWLTGGHRLVDLLDSGPTARGSSTVGPGHTAWHTTGHAAGWHTTCRLVQVGDDWHAYFLELLLVVFKLVLLGRLWTENDHCERECNENQLGYFYVTIVRHSLSFQKSVLIILD